MFHHIHSGTMDTMEADRGFLERAFESWLCKECKSPIPGTQSVDVTVIRFGFDRKAGLNGVTNCGLGVARRDLLTALGEDLVTRNLYIGQVLGDDGMVLDDFATFVPRHELICPWHGKRLARSPHWRPQMHDLRQA